MSLGQNVGTKNVTRRHFGRFQQYETAEDGALSYKSPPSQPTYPPSPIVPKIMSLPFSEHRETDFGGEVCNGEGVFAIGSATGVDSMLKRVRMRSSRLGFDGIGGVEAFAANGGGVATRPGGGIADSFFSSKRVCRGGGTDGGGGGGGGNGVEAGEGGGNGMTPV